MTIMTREQMLYTQWEHTRLEYTSVARDRKMNDGI